LKLRDKTLLIIGATFIILTLVLNLLSRTILLDNFDQLQAEAIQQNLRHALKLIKNQTEQINISLSDWAPWDDSYRFIQDGNQEYIDSNLVPDTFTNLQLNLIVYVDTSGKVIYSRAWKSNLQSGF
jgi:sensor domain CHASE-containing protein